MPTTKEDSYIESQSLALGPIAGIVRHVTN